MTEVARSPLRGPIPGVQVTPTGLSIDDSVVGFNELVELVEEIVDDVNSAGWKIGDALNAVRRYRNRYPEGVEKLERKYQTLKNFAWVANKVAQADRFEQLSWSHHRAVASLDPPAQRLWLEDAIRHGWTVADLEQELRATRPGSTALTAPPAAPLHLSVDPERVKRWADYAERHDMGVTELVTKATDSYIQAELA